MEQYKFCGAYKWGRTIELVWAGGRQKNYLSVIRKSPRKFTDCRDGFIGYSAKRQETNNPYSYPARKVRIL